MILRRFVCESCGAGTMVSFLTRQLARMATAIIPCSGCGALHEYDGRSAVLKSATEHVPGLPWSAEEFEKMKDAAERELARNYGITPAMIGEPAQASTTDISADTMAAVLFWQYRSSWQRAPDDLPPDVLELYAASKAPGVSTHEYYLVRAKQIIKFLESHGLCIVPRLKSPHEVLGDQTKCVGQADQMVFGGYDVRRVHCCGYGQCHEERSGRTCKIPPAP